VGCIIHEEKFDFSSHIPPCRRNMIFSLPESRRGETKKIISTI
jgi:hypothetical protein